MLNGEKADESGHPRLLFGFIVILDVVDRHRNDPSIPHPRPPRRRRRSNTDNDDDNDIDDGRDRDTIG